ncbi:MAG: hypothetical protein Crog3KO_13640 [Crocinitomicaceae bacterium]
MSFGLSKYQLGSTRDILNVKYPESFGPFLLQYGITASPCILVNGKRAFDMHLDLMIYDNHGNNTPDSVNYSWGGWHFGYDFGFDLFPGVRPIDIIVGVGFNTGRFKLTQQDQAGVINVNTNPFLAPKIILEPRFVIKQLFCFSIRSELMADVTSGSWRNKSNGVDDLGATKATGFSVLLTISRYLGSRDFDVQD